MTRVYTIQFVAIFLATVLSLADFQIANGQRTGGIDSIVLIKKVIDGKELIEEGIVFRVDEDKAFIVARLMAWQPEEDLDQPIESVEAIVYPGQLQSEVVAVEKICSQLETGYGDIYVADAAKMPPPLELAELSELTEGDEVSGVSILRGTHADTGKKVTQRTNLSGEITRIVSEQRGDSTNLFLFRQVR